MMRSAGTVRLDSFENYVRGIVATTRQEKVRRFREAIRSNPQYTLAIFQLGKTYYSNREYDSATNWLSRIPQSGAEVGRSIFPAWVGLLQPGAIRARRRGVQGHDFKMPLTEVYNNLGAAALRRGRRSALQLLQQTVEVDPHDPDYRFNFALALYRYGDPATAVKNLRESLARYPTDSEARQFLEEITGRRPRQRRKQPLGAETGGDSDRGCFRPQHAASPHQTELRRDFIQAAGA